MTNELALLLRVPLTLARIWYCWTMCWPVSMLTLSVIPTVSQYPAPVGPSSNLLPVDHVIGPSGLLATRARILVTNNVSFLTDCSNIILIRRGIILESGSFETIMNREHGEIKKLM